MKLFERRNVYKRMVFSASLFLLLVFFIPSVAHASTKHYLIADTNNHRVIEVDANRNITWQYGTIGVSESIWEHRVAGIPGDGQNKLNFPLSAIRLQSGNTLITEGGNQRVVEVSSKKQIVWQFDGRDAGELFYPVRARRLKNGNILIVDLFGHRVVEVSKDKKVVWQYGKVGEPGSEPGQLNHPQDAVRLENGNTLITDTGNERVVEVTVDKELVWQYGVTGRGWVGDDYLHHPLSAVRLEGGNTLITDEENSRVIEVDCGKQIIWQYGGSKGCAEGQLNYPYNAARVDSGNTLIADHTNHRVIEVDPEGKIIWQYGDNYRPGNGPNQLLYPADAQEVVVPLTDSSIAKELQALPPLNDDKYSLGFIWILFAWAAFCFTVVFGLYYLTSKERGA